MRLFRHPAKPSCLLLPSSARQRLASFLILGFIIGFGRIPVAAAQQATLTDTAKEAIKWLNLGGSLRADYFSSSRDLDERDNLAGLALYLKAAPQLGTQASLFFEGWFRNSALFNGGPTQGKLREGYLDLSLGPMDFRFGKQLIIWGRADRINPTDNLVPRDFTLLVPEDDDQRLGAPAMKATLHISDIAITGIWLPVFRPHRLPFPHEPGTFLREIIPATTWNNGQGALRLEQTGGPVDWSISYFNGFDLYPDLAFGGLFSEPSGSSTVEVLLRHHRFQVIGADVATTLGRFGLRGEIAYAITADRKGDNPEIKNPYLFMVLGVDRTFLEYFNVNIQYLFRAITNFQDPEKIQDPIRRLIAIQQSIIANQLDRFQHGASLRISQKWLNETLETELGAVYGFTRRDYVIRPKAVYDFTDRIRGTVGADFFGGPKKSFFGRIKDTSTAYVELKFSF
jgi:hypothetical protein